MHASTIAFAQSAEEIVVTGVHSLVGPIPQVCSNEKKILLTITQAPIALFGDVNYEN